jgi:hypothetical protein
MLGGSMRGRSRRLVLLCAGLGAVVMVGGAGFTSCGPPPSGGGGTTTTVKATTTTKPKPTTTVKATTTTTTPAIVDDPAEELVSVGADGSSAHYPSTDTATSSAGNAVISGDGRYVAFSSNATNLVPGDTNGLWDIFVRDRVLGTTERISVKSDGSQVTANDLTGTANTTAAASLWSMTADGRYVTFTSYAQLVPQDTNQNQDIYLFDRTTQTVQLVDVSGTGSGFNSSDTPLAPSVSTDGRYVVFQSTSPSLVSGDTDPPPDQFLYKDGNWPDVFLFDRVAGTTTLLSVSTDSNGAFASNPSITPDGRYVLFTGSGNIVPGLTTSQLDEGALVYDTTTGTVQLASYDSSGAPTSASADAISADGNTVVWYARNALQMVTPDTPAKLPQGSAGQLYSYNRATGATTLVDVDGFNITNDREPLEASVSADGHYASFQCWCQREFNGPNGMGHLGIYRADLVARTVAEVDANLSGVVANGDSSAGLMHSITADGSNIVFESFGSNLVPGDNNDHADQFVSTPAG